MKWFVHLRIALIAALLSAYFSVPALGQQAETGAKPQAKTLVSNGQDVAVPDLRPLVGKRENEMRAVVLRFDEDRGSLNRFYTISLSPVRQARMRLFYDDWLKALSTLDSTTLNSDARSEYDGLRERIQKDLSLLDEDARANAEVAPFVPFASTILSLDDRRRRIETMDPAKAAGTLTGLAVQIAQARNTQGILREKAVSDRAATTVDTLRSVLKNWFGFYNDYDPLFTWWIAQPYREADKRLQDCAAFLREPLPSNGSSAGSSISSSSSVNPAEVQPIPPYQSGKEPEIPDLKELMSSPHSEMSGVVQRYESERGGRGGRGSARSREFFTGWLAALEQLDFDSFGRDAKIDYILLRNRIEYERHRLDLPSQIDRPLVRDASGIAGRPIGREGLLVELAGEMVPYAPEELIAIAEKEMAWCETELKKASRKMGFGDDWKRAVEKTKELHVEPGKQPYLIRDLAREAIDFIEKRNLVTVPEIARESWRMIMMTPERQLVNPFFTGGETISVSYPTSTMSQEAKLQSMRGNNIHFARATVFHELIPGHHLQGFMAARYNTHRRLFQTPFWGEGWALYWELLLWDMNFPKTPENRIGMLFWRMHRCARIIFSLSFHLGKMTPQQCVDFLVDRVGHERENAAAEVRRSFNGSYTPLYQAAYLLGGIQLRSLHKELVETGKMSNRTFHDAILKGNSMPIEMVRVSLTNQPLTRDYAANWKFYSSVPGATASQRTSAGGRRMNSQADPTAHIP